MPELPLKVEIERFALQELALGEPLLGQAARLSAEGKAKLGPPTEGLDLTFTTKRLDQPGTIDIKIGLVPKTQGLTVKVKAQEPQGGLIAHLAQLPDLPPVDLDIDGKGSLDAFISRVIFAAGADIGADGNATLTRQGDGRWLNLAMTARIEGLCRTPSRRSLAARHDSTAISCLPIPARFRPSTSRSSPGPPKSTSPAAWPPTKTSRS